MLSFVFVLKKVLFFISLMVFSPYVFAHNGEMFGVIIGVLVLLVYILFAICVLAFVCKKWNQTNKTLEEIKKNMIKD